MEKAIIYCRVSTEEQAENGHHSLAAQESICRRLALEKGYNIVRVFKDPGKSATNMNRPGLKDALAFCQTGESIKVLLVQDTDRLARNTQDHLAIRAILKKAGVILISASQPMLEDSAEGNMIDTIIASVNQFQSDITSRKTVKGLEEKVRNGGWPCQAPLGYKNIGQGEGGRERIVVLDPETAPIIKKMFKYYATGNYSLHELRDIMYSEGLRSRNAKKIHVSKVHAMLLNPFYIGIVRWRGIEVKGQHKPLIEEGLFGAVDNALRLNGGQRGRRRTHDFLLKGYLYCAECGSRLIGECHINKKATYYRCHKRGGCGPSTPVKEIENGVSQKFDEISMPTQFTDAVVKALRSKVNRDHDAIGANKTRLENRRTKVEKQIIMLEQKWLDKIITDDDFARMKKRLLEDQKGIENGISELKWQQNTNIDEVQEVINFTNNLGSSYLKAAPNVKRMLLRFAWERFNVRGNQIINAFPSVFIRAIYQATEASRIARKPVLSDRACVLWGVYHPLASSLGDMAVRIKTQRGRVRDTNSTQKRKKVAGQDSFSSSIPLFNLIKDRGYMAQLLEQYQAIKYSLKS